ncbi:MAG TPA: RagB/SusD family nutrient uptake outer membrane protein [Puia sp.]|nr:RagB/SusD family nutrient uptake outer membrane protein [Puia sp.]
MNTQIIKAVIYITLIGFVVSCKKNFLEVVPLGSQVAATTDDYDKLMNSPDFYFYSYDAGWAEPVSMGDDVAAEAPYLNQGSAQMQRLFQWADDIYQLNDGMPGDLQLLLTNMYTCNKIINEVLRSSGGTDSQKISLQVEAMATRAWLNFQFINFYGKPYLSSTASSDPGFPIITSADVTISGYTRASVQAVYDFIIKDLTAAIVALPVKASIQTRMSRPAAEGLLGKVYLFMGRYSDALPMLNAAFSDITSSGAPVLYDYNQTFGPGGSFLPIDSYSGPNSPGNNYQDLTEDIVSKVFGNGPNGNMLGNNGLVITPATAALYDASDWRLQFYSANNLDGSPNPGGRLRKYGVSYSRFGLQLPELYLLRAECKTRLNDLAGAKVDLETLRKNRMPVADALVPAAVANDQTALIKFTIDERIREFAAEGYRWFDMRRLSVDPLFSGQSFTHTLYNDDASNSTAVYTLKQPNRLVLRLAPIIINANPGMPNNP